MDSHKPDDLTGDEAIEALAQLNFRQLERAFGAVTRTAARVLAVDRVSIWLFSAGLDSLHRVHEYPEDGRRGFALTLDMSRRPAYAEALQGESLFRLSATAIRSPDSDDEFGRYLAQRGVIALLDGAIRVDDVLVGVLCHEHGRARRWRSVDRRRVVRLGEIVAGIIEDNRRRRAAAIGARFRSLVEGSVDAIAMASPQGNIDYLNPQARQLLGLARDEPLYGIRLVDFLEPESRERATQRIYPAARETGSWTGRLQMRSRRREGFEATVTLNVYRGADGDVEYLSIVIRGLSGHPDLEHRIDEMRKRYETALAHSGECIMIVDAQSLALQNANAGFEALLGYSAARRDTLTLYDLCADPPETLRALMERAGDEGHLLCGEKQVRHVQGQWIDVEMSMMRLDRDPVPMISIGLRDISERVQRRRDIERMAYYDPLTGLANSNLLRERAEPMLAQSLTGGPLTGFILLQMDRWQRIFDIQGYQIAESLILQVGNRLRRVFENRDVLLARVLGGVEFGLLYNIDTETTHALVETAHTAFKRPFRAGDESLQLSIRSGSARAPTHAVNFKDLTKRAGIALRSAHLRHLPHCDYDPAQSGRLQDERLLEEDLRRAIGTRQIQLRYQPVRAIGNSTRQWSGVEVLARWRHPQLGLLVPDDFIPVAEDSNLIIELDRQILRKTAMIAAGWQGDMARLSLAVNLSAITLLGSDVIDILEQVLDETGLPASRLCLEITETSIMKDRANAAERLARIKALGVFIALDDFGTGYSSLAYLKDLPVDALKIDRDFVRGIGADSRDESTIETIIRLGHNLGMQVLAEGVETRFQLEWLGKRDIDYVQGYYIGMPLKVAELSKGRTRARRTH